jgi:hypothetical protein
MAATSAETDLLSFMQAHARDGHGEVAAVTLKTLGSVNKAA